jgi:hypothetical protein
MAIISVLLSLFIPSSPRQSAVRWLLDRGGFENYHRFTIRAGSPLPQVRQVLLAILFGFLRLTVVPNTR